MQGCKIKPQKASWDLGIENLTFGAYRSERSFSSSHEILELESSWRPFSPTPPLIYRWDSEPIEETWLTRGHTVPGGKAKLGIPASPVRSNLSRITLQGEEWRVHTQKQRLCWVRLLGSVAQQRLLLDEPSLPRMGQKKRTRLLAPRQCVWVSGEFCFLTWCCYLTFRPWGKIKHHQPGSKATWLSAMNPSAVINQPWFLARPLIQEENKSGANIRSVIYRTSWDLQQTIGPS